MGDLKPSETAHHVSAAEPSDTHHGTNRAAATATTGQVVELRILRSVVRIDSH